MSTQSQNSVLFRVVIGFALALLLPCVMPEAELMQRIHAGIEGVARGMDYVGRRAGEVFGPGVSLLGEADGKHTVSREFDEQYPSGPSPMVVLSNEFGDVRVNVWDERLVRISAQIVVGVESEALAAQLADLVEIRVSPGEDFLECTTHFPAFKGNSDISMAVNYDVVVPREAGLVVDNFFGDVAINGVAGLLAVDVQYGGLELSQIQGQARIRAQGEFPVKVQGLRQGGTFKLQGSTAEFIDVQGELDISHFRGAVTLRQMAPETTLLLSSDSGRAQLILTPNTMPDLTVSALYGTFESDLDMTRTRRGQQLLARHPNAEASQRITINSAFSNVIVAVEGSASESLARATGESRPFTDVRTETVPRNDVPFLDIYAMPGSIQLVGADTDVVEIESTRIVWTPSAAAALDALDLLETGTTFTEEAMVIASRITGDLSVFGAETCRVDLRITCPRDMQIRLHAEEGNSVVNGLGMGATLFQAKGDVIVEHVKGTLVVNNSGGPVTVSHCSGPVEINAVFGVVTVEEVFGDIDINSEEGRVYVDAPRGNLRIRHQSGEVRVLSLEPVAGEIDVLVKEGRLNVFVAPESDASITTRTGGGRIQSTLPLSGAINRDSQEFFGRLNEGTHPVRLEITSGDLFLN